MSSQFKALLGLIIGLLSLFSTVTVDTFNLPNIFLFTRTIPLLISIVSIILGISARKSGSQIFGLITLVIGIIGFASHFLALFNLYFLDIR